MPSAPRALATWLAANLYTGHQRDSSRLCRRRVLGGIVTLEAARCWRHARQMRHRRALRHYRQLRRLSSRLDDSGDSSAGPQRKLHATRSCRIPGRRDFSPAQLPREGHVGRARMDLHRHEAAALVSGGVSALGQRRTRRGVPRFEATLDMTLTSGCSSPDQMAFPQDGARGSFPRCAAEPRNARVGRFRAAAASGRRQAGGRSIGPREPKEFRCDGPNTSRLAHPDSVFGEPRQLDTSREAPRLPATLTCGRTARSINEFLVLRGSLRGAGPLSLKPRNHMRVSTAVSFSPTRPSAGCAAAWASMGGPTAPRGGALADTCPALNHLLDPYLPKSRQHGPHTVGM
jgi:hypothetical protein